MDAPTVALLLAGLLLFAVVITWQIRAIVGSRLRACGAVEALASAIPLFLLLFAMVYFKMADLQAQVFSEPLTRTDSLYYTITVFSTVVSGDITPVTQAGPRRDHGADAGDLVVVGLVLQVMLGAVKYAGQRRDTASAGSAESSDREDAGQAGPPHTLASTTGSAEPDRGGQRRWRPQPILGSRPTCWSCSGSAATSPR